MKWLFEMDDRQDLAAIDSEPEELSLQGDDALFRSLVSGAHVENAAQAAGVSERTAYRRLSDPGFRQRIDEARESLRKSMLAKLSDAAGDAVSTLWSLLESDDETVRLRASKTLIDSLLAVQRSEPSSQTVVTKTLEQRTINRSQN